MLRSVTLKKPLIYLGHKLITNGKEPDENKVRSITEMPAPKDKNDMQRLLGAEKLILENTFLTTPLKELGKKSKPAISEGKIVVGLKEML